MFLSQQVRSAESTVDGIPRNNSVAKNYRFGRINRVEQEIIQNFNILGKV